MNEIKDSNAERNKIKRNSILLWIALVLCIGMAVVFWFLMNNSNPEYKEVKAIVLSSEKTEYINRKTNSKTYKYDVKVEYTGKTYDLENAHDVYSYPEGKEVTAYLANEKLYANVEGVKTNTTVAKIYFVFLFGSLGLLIYAPSYTAKLKQYKKVEEEKE